MNELLAFVRFVFEMNQILCHGVKGINTQDVGTVVSSHMDKHGTCFVGKVLVDTIVGIRSLGIRGEIVQIRLERRRTHVELGCEHHGHEE